MCTIRSRSEICLYRSKKTILKIGAAPFKMVSSLQLNSFFLLKYCSYWKTPVSMIRYRQVLGCAKYIESPSIHLRVRSQSAGGLAKLQKRVELAATTSQSHITFSVTYKPLLCRGNREINKNNPESSAGARRMETDLVLPFFHYLISSNYQLYFAHGIFK